MRQPTNYTMTSLNDEPGLRYTVQDQHIDLKFSDLSPERKAEIMEVGIVTLMGRRMINKEWTPANVEEAAAQVRSGARSRGAGSTLVARAYVLFRRYVAINAGKEDPKLTEEQASEAIKAMPDTDLKKLKANGIFKIAYGKVQADDLEKQMQAH